MKALYTEPLARAGLTLLDVDRFSLELHNPEATEPAGSGNVPLNNYRTLASLAVIEKLIERDGIDDFVRTRGMPGFSPTQGHIASAIPYLGHALRGLTEGEPHADDVHGEGEPVPGTDDAAVGRRVADRGTQPGARAPAGVREERGYGASRQEGDRAR